MIAHHGPGPGLVFCASHLLSSSTSEERLLHPMLTKKKEKCGTWMLRWVNLAPFLHLYMLCLGSENKQISEHCSEPVTLPDPHLLLPIASSSQVVFIAQAVISLEVVVPHLSSEISGAHHHSQLSISVSMSTGDFLKNVRSFLLASVSLGCF